MLKLGLSESESRDAVDAIERSAMMQAQMIDDVLDVSRIVAGKMTFRPAPVDLGSVLNAAMTTVHPAASAKGIEILSSLPPVSPYVLGDEGRLQQVIWNLLSNAVKFTPRGGAITVRLVSAGPVVRLTVQDNGKGIDPSYLPHAFEPFSQEDGTTTRSHEGIGLGLSIVRSLVELHGGTIRAASEGLGRGATFTVELPAIEAVVAVDGAAKAPAIVAPTRSLKLAALSGIRILVIDDQEFTRDLVVAVFQRTDATVTAASSVREGLKEFEATLPHVVVCDLAMPEQDGFAFLRAIRSRPDPSRDTPIIALTAFGRPEDRQQALAAGFNAYLKKPVDLEELTSTVLLLHRARP